MMKRATNAAVADAVTTGTQPLTTAEAPDLDTMTKPQLYDFAETIEVTLDSTWPRADCVKALRLAMAAKAGFVDVPKEKSVQTLVLESLTGLVDQNKHKKAPGIDQWSACAPAEKILLWMREKGLPAELFQSGDDLAAFLRVPGNAKLFKAAGILLSYPPWQGKTLIRVERGDPEQYHRTDI
jgi:hypothetical protein